MFRRVSTQYENVTDIRTEGYRDSVARQKTIAEHLAYCCITLAKRDI